LGGRAIRPPVSARGRVERGRALSWNGLGGGGAPRGVCEASGGDGSDADMRNEGEIAIPSTSRAGTGQGEAPATGPRVCGLSSARDRARLREREQAERARVEKVLARGPRDLERRRREREDAAAGPDAISVTRPATSGSRAAVCCRVCGGHEVVQDEVNDRGVFRLAHCLRCEHRWTERGREGFEPVFRRTLQRARRASLEEKAGARHANGA
jgi:DNA-directed RNA polymerase subunit M/transcription elongation factor TFIIS